MSTATVCHHATGSSSLFVRRRPCAADSRYDNGYEAARQKIWSGDFGALKTIVMHSTSSLFNGSSHCLDVANILNNDSPVRWVQADLEDDADETTSMMEQVDGENLLRGEPQGHGMYRCENGVTVCECHRPTPPRSSA